MLRAFTSTPGPVLALALALALAGCESDHTLYDAELDTAEVADSGEATDGDEDGGEADGAPEVVGTDTCAEVLTCIQACADTPCIDGCRAAICPAGATELGDLMTCVADHCETACADFTASGCMTCVTGSCMTQATACYTATCT
jgi:hypothetical protein